MADKRWISTASGDWATGANWSPAVVPTTGDNVRIPAGMAAITTGLNQSAIALGYVIVEAGYLSAIGSSAAYLQLNCTRFEFSGTGEAWIDLGASAISPQIFATSTNVVAGKRGLYLKGSALVTLNVVKGKVGVAVVHGETATVATVRVVDKTADVWLGAGVTVTTIQGSDGSAEVRGACTTLTVHGGNVKTTEVGAVGTLTVNGGNVYPESTGTITSVVLNGGFTDFTGSGAARIATTLKQNPGAVLVYDPAVLTITTRAAPDYPIQLTAAKPQ